MSMQAPKRKPPTSQEIVAQQKRDAARQQTAIKPAAAPPVVAVADNRTPQQKYLDEVAPSSIVGRLIKFSKAGVFITADDDEPIGEGVEFFALCGETQIGWIRFKGEGEPPERIMGLFYDNYEMPARVSLGDNDSNEWPLGLSGQPADPWLHQQNLVLQHCDTRQLYTFSTTSPTGRRAVGNLLRHFDRMRRSNPDDVPVVRLKAGGFQHKQKEIGWVATPVFAVVGKAPRDSAARPDTSPAADMDDDISEF